MLKKTFISFGLIVILAGTLVFAWATYVGYTKEVFCKIASEYLPGLKIFENPNPDTTRIYGIDISHHQKHINWKKVSEWEGQKIRFAYIKATEGGTHRDTRYVYNIINARKHGLLTGSYHYYRPRTTPQRQFKNFTSVVKKRYQDIIPVIDIEETKGVSKEKFIEDLSLFLIMVEKHYGVKPLLYTTRRLWWSYLQNDFNNFKIFMGYYGCTEPSMSISQTWTIWQFTELGRVKGIPTFVDIDVLNPDMSLHDLKIPEQ